MNLPTGAKHPLDREPLGQATHVRGSLLLSSAQALRSIGLFEQYEARLPPASRTAIFSGSAADWHPMRVAIDHYEACDALDLSIQQQVDIGHQVSDRVQGTFIALLLRVARNMGVSPWTVIDHFDKIYDRVFQGGGGTRVTRLGPKEARCKLAGLPILNIAYLRNAWRGAFLAGMERFCERILVTELPAARSPGTAVYRISWV